METKNLYLTNLFNIVNQHNQMFEKFQNKCQICGWNKKPEGAKYTPCELDHIDGNPTKF